MHFHKWSKWSEPVNVDCTLVQKRNCDKCNKVTFNVVSSAHDYEIKEQKEWTSTSSIDSKYLHTCVIRQCKICGCTSTIRDAHLMVSIQ